jgi:hypothetical protein
MYLIELRGQFATAFEGRCTLRGQAAGLFGRMRGSGGQSDQRERMLALIGNNCGIIFQRSSYGLRPNVTRLLRP